MSRLGGGVFLQKYNINFFLTIIVVVKHVHLCYMVLL